MEPEVKKRRGRKPGQKNADKTNWKLPSEGSNVSPELFKAIQESTRLYDVMHISEKLKGQWSKPVITNFLKTGYCTDPELRKAVVKFFDDRNAEELAESKRLLKGEAETTEAAIKLLKAKKADFVRQMDEL